MKLDVHSIIHFVGSYALTLTFFIWPIPYYWLWALGLGILWEVFDEINSWIFVYWPDFSVSWLGWLDRRGFDFVDVGVDFLGVVLACFLILSL